MTPGFITRFIKKSNGGSINTKSFNKIVDSIRQARDDDKKQSHLDDGAYFKYCANVTQLLAHTDWAVAFVNSEKMQNGDMLHRIKLCILHGFFTGMDPDYCAERLKCCFPIASNSKS